MLNLSVSGALSNPGFYSLSNQVQTVASSLVGVSNQVVVLFSTINTISNQSSWTSNQLPLYTPLSSTQSFSNDSYAKISSNNSSIRWTSNSLVSLSPLILGQYCSNLATYGSNSAAAAQTTANFCSNLIPTFMTSNVFYPLRSYDSNTSTWSSNQLATLNTTANFTSSPIIFHL
jgi:hypothetical protein